MEILTRITFLSIITGLITEAVKATLDSFKINYSSNIVALIVAIIVGVGGTAILYIYTGVAFTSINILTMILMGVINWIGAMVGYDKIKQAIEQLKVG